MKKTKDIKNKHLRVRCEEHLRQDILSLSKELKVRPSAFIRFALEKAIREVPHSEIDLFLLRGKPNVNSRFTCELDGYFLEVLNGDTAFITYPNGDKERLEEPFSKEVVFDTPGQALKAFHYEVEKDILLRG